MADLMEQELAQDSLVACDHWSIDQCWHVARTLHYYSGRSHDQSHAIYMALVCSTCRNCAHNRIVCFVYASLHAGFTAYSSGTRLGSAAGSGSSYHSQDRQS